MPPPDLIHQGHLDFITSLLLQTIDKYYDDICRIITLLLFVSDNLSTKLTSCKENKGA